MAVINLKVEKLPSNITESRLRELFSTKGRVISLKISGSSASIQMESEPIRLTLLRSYSRTMGMISLLSMDSSGLGELKFSTVSLL